MSKRVVCIRSADEDRDDDDDDEEEAFSARFVNAVSKRNLFLPCCSSSVASSQRDTVMQKRTTGFTDDDMPRPMRKKSSSYSART